MLQKILPEDDQARKWMSIIITIIIAGLLTIWGIYGIGQYGVALFILTPLFIGANPAILFGYRKQITKKDSFLLGLVTLVLFTLLLLAFAIEGLICIAMAMPIALLLMWAGSLIGYAIINKTPSNGPMSMLILIIMIPGMSFVDKRMSPSLTSVVTSIEINAVPETVWKNVIAFPQLSKPKEFIFKVGIAYPINAKIDGTGVGAIRHCNFTTGSFVEPVTVWREPQLLKFSVEEQPEPLKEISFWNIDAPHLHDYFVSKEGQFKLTALPNGRTLLEGTTWYYHNIKPEFYWHFWSSNIIHKIHERVLNHIKLISEKQVSTHYN